MPPAPLAVDAVTGTRDLAGAPGTCTPAPVAPSHGPRTAPRARRLIGLLRRAAKTGGSYYDPLFARPDLVEDDYYRFRHQARGW